MADITSLLSGSDPDEPEGLFAPEGARASGLAAQAREWCQTPPDDDALQWLAATLGSRRSLRKAIIGTRRNSA